MIKLTEILNAKKWVEYDSLSKPQKDALYEYMVTSGGVEADEYKLHVNKFLYKLYIINPNEVIKVWNKWGWPTDVGSSQQFDDADGRIKAIKKIHNRGGDVWPYIIGNGKTFQEWAKDESNHGDGFHRLTLALHENRPIEFLALKLKKS